VTEIITHIKKFSVVLLLLSRRGEESQGSSASNGLSGRVGAEELLGVFGKYLPVLTDPPRGRPFGGGGVYLKIRLKRFLLTHPNFMISRVSEIMLHFQKIIGFYEDNPPQGLSEARRIRKCSDNYSDPDLFRCRSSGHGRYSLEESKCYSYHNGAGANIHVMLP